LEAVRKENGVSRAASDELLPMDPVRQVAPTWCSLMKMAEDVYDSCVRIDIQLARDNLPPEEREHLVLEKGMHL